MSKKRWICCLALLMLLAGCQASSQNDAQPEWLLDQSQSGMRFWVPPSWASAQGTKGTVYTTPQKQVMSVHTLPSGSSQADMQNPVDKENFYFIARKEATNQRFTQEQALTIDGENGLRVSYETLNGAEVMYVVQVGVIRGERMYLFAFLMPEAAREAGEFDRVIQGIRLE